MKFYAKVSHGKLSIQWNICQFRSSLLPQEWEVEKVLNDDTLNTFIENSEISLKFTVKGLINWERKNPEAIIIRK